MSNLTLAVLSFGAAFGLAVFLIWVLTPMSTRLGLLDHPGDRKCHDDPTPTTGGVAILIAMLITMLLAIPDVDSGTRGFCIAALIVTVTGAIDDRFDLSWQVRMLVQILAVLVMVKVGDIRVSYLGNVFGLGPIQLDDLSIPATVFVTVGIINAINMIDGSDGLAGLLVAGALGMLIATAMYSDNPIVYMQAPILLGAVAGFLLFNLRLPGRPKARIFMGDAGSALLGLGIAYFSFRLTQNDAHPVGPILALWLIPIPILDCLVLMVRRVRSGRSPFSGDRGHIHHLMQEGGFSPSGIAFALLGVSLVSGLLAGLVLRQHVPQVMLVGAFLLLCMAYYWLTARRQRAVAFFSRLRNPRTRLGTVDAQNAESNVASLASVTSAEETGGKPFDAQRFLSK